MSAYVSLECPKHGWSDVDTSSVGCPACEIDHIRRERTLAQIAVLEEEDAHMVSFHGGHYCDENREHRNFMLAALRKELGA